MQRCAGYNIVQSWLPLGAFLRYFFSRCENISCPLHSATNWPWFTWLHADVHSTANTNAGNKTSNKTSNANNNRHQNANINTPPPPSSPLSPPLPSSPYTASAAAAAASVLPPLPSQTKRLPRARHLASRRPLWLLPFPQVRKVESPSVVLYAKCER